MTLSPPICMVLLPAPARFDAETVTAMLSSAFPPEAEATLDQISENGDTLDLRIDGRAHSVFSIPTSIPSESFANPLAQPGTDDLDTFVSKHRAHLIVTCLEPGTEMGESVVAASTTHLLAACLGAQGKALAGFWLPSTRLCSWVEFESYAEAVLPVLTEGNPIFPTRYWVSVQLTREGDHHGGTTMGLAPFTDYEIEMTPIPWPMQDVAGRLVGVVTYLFTEGPVLKDGETLGVSETERFRIGRAVPGKIMLNLEGA